MEIPRIPGVSKFLIFSPLSPPGTFKLQKIDLQKESFDIEKMKGDSIYFFKEGSYVPLDKELYQDLITGKIRV